MAGFLVLRTVRSYLDELHGILTVNCPKEKLFRNSEKGKKLEGYDTEMFYLERVKEV